MDEPGMVSTDQINRIFDASFAADRDIETQFYIVLYALIGIAKMAEISVDDVTAALEGNWDIPSAPGTVQ